MFVCREKESVCREIERVCQEIRRDREIVCAEIKREREREYVWRDSVCVTDRESVCVGRESESVCLFR